MYKFSEDAKIGLKLLLMLFSGRTKIMYVNDEIESDKLTKAQILRLAKRAKKLNRCNTSTANDIVSQEANDKAWMHVNAAVEEMAAYGFDVA